MTDLYKILGVRKNATDATMTEDVVEAMVALLEKQIEAIAQGSAGLALRRKVLMDMAGRFETREEGADNVLEAVLTGLLSSLDQEQRLNEDQKTLHKAALALIKTRKFRKDVKKQMAMQQVYMRIGGMGSASTTGGW